MSLQPVGPVNALSPPECDIHIILHCKKATFNTLFFRRINELYLLGAMISFRSLVWRQVTYIKEPKQRRNKLVHHHQCNRFPNTTSRTMPKSVIRSFHTSDTLLECSGVLIVSLQPAARVEKRSVRAKYFGQLLDVPAIHADDGPQGNCDTIRQLEARVGNDAL